MNYDLFKNIIIGEMKKNSLWDEEYTFRINKNIRGQSKSIFIEKNNNMVYVAKFFNYIEDVDIKLTVDEWKNITTLENYLNYLDEHYDIIVEEISEILELKKRCFTRYIIASNETEDVFPKVLFNIDEIYVDCSIGGILLEEAIQGITLEEKMKALSENKDIRIKESMDFLIRMSQKMYSYFSKGFVHRDLSPDNIITSIQNGIVDYKIIDPGVVKIVSRNSTKGKVCFCKRNYSSPEQYIGNGTNVNFTSDIYVLGIVVYEYITGINLIENYYKPEIYPHDIINGLLHRTIEEKFYEGITIDSEKIDRLYLIIKKMLQLRKDDRFESPESFVSIIDTLKMKGVGEND